MSKMVVFAAMIAFGMFSLSVTSSPVRAETAYLLKNAKSGRCLDARDSDPGGNNPNSLPNGTIVQLWDCWGGAMQQWVLVGDGSIRNVKSGRCLDARDSDALGNNPNSLPDGTAIQLWDCWGGSMQHWALDGQRSTYVNAKAGRCLDATDPDPGGSDPNSLPNGTAIELWDCWGGSMQQWNGALVPLPVNCNPAFTIGGLFLERYVQEPFSEELGCATSVEMDHPDGGGGRYQTFERGAMAYSPNTGPRSVQIGYAVGGPSIGLKWSTTDPFTYDKFVVRIDRDGINIGQDDISQQSLPNNAGRWQWSWLDGTLIPGMYRLVVEGCDENWLGHNTCRQGFSLPVYVGVR